MKTVSKQIVDGVEYEIMDSTARTQISSLETDLEGQISSLETDLEGQIKEIRYDINLFDKNTTNDGWLYGDNFEKESKDFAGQSAPIKVNPGQVIHIWDNAQGFPIIGLGSNDIDDPFRYQWITATTKDGRDYAKYTVPENTPYISIGFLLVNKNKIVAFSDESDEIGAVRESVESNGNPNNELFEKNLANIGWYITEENGAPKKVIAAWAAESAPIKVSSGDVITIYGAASSLEDGINAITMPDYGYGNIQRVKGLPAVKLVDGKAVFQYVVPNNAEYMAFSFVASRLNNISVFRGEKLYNAKLAEVAAIGDSITYGHITSSIRANPTWLDIVGSTLHCITYNHGLSGSGICNGEVTPLTTILGNMTEAWLDCLVIAAGTNDYGDERAHTLGSISDEPAQGTNFYASFKYLIEQAVNKYPMAQILVITPMRRRYGNENQYGISIEDIVNAEVEVARYYGVKCFDFFHEGGINPANDWQRVTYTQDGLHPNQKGIDLFLGPRFSEEIKRLVSGRGY